MDVTSLWEDNMTVEQMERRLGYLSLYAMISSLLIAVLILTAFRPGSVERQRMDELSVQRLNIVEPDGRHALILANQDRLPGPILNGREIDQRQGMAGMLFFNDRGDEAGGLIVGSQRSDGSDRHLLHFSFDGYRDDQVLALQHVEDEGSTGTRIRIIDRAAPFPFAELADKAWLSRNGTVDEREEARRWLEQHADAYSDGVAERVVLGSVNRVASLELKDPEGRPRIRLEVDSLGAPTMQLLDENGEVTRNLAN